MLKMEYFYYMKEVCQTNHLIVQQKIYSTYLNLYLSQTLKKIEQQLGVSLQGSSNKGISLTDAGKEFLNISKEIIQLNNRQNLLHKQYECFPKS